MEYLGAIWMGVIVIILQQIDANIINPKIVGDSLKISPLLVIFAVTIGGAYFGILGMFLAVPVVAVVKILLLDFINIRADQRGDQKDMYDLGQSDQKEMTKRVTKKERRF